MNGQTTILGSGVDANDYRYQMDVTSEGAIPISGTININNIAGSIVIGSVSANVDLGSVYVIEDIPTAGINNNPSWSFVYDNDGNVGSVYQMIGTGSYVNTITWIGFSGTSIGTGSRVTNISEWSVV